MLSIHHINRQVGRIFRWVASAASKDSSHPNLCLMHVQAPYVEATDGSMIHRAEFADPQKIRDIVEADGLYELRAVHTNFMVLENREDCNYPNLQPIFNDAIKAKGELHLSRSEQPTNMPVQFALALDAAKIMKTMSIMPVSTPTYFHFGSESSPVFIQNTIDADPLYGKVNLTAVVMPMSGNNFPSRQYSDSLSLTCGYSLSDAR